MNIDRTRIKSFGALFTVLACLTLFTAGSALGAVQDYYLKAMPFTIAANTINNPAAITMWGYASCTDNTFGTGGGQSCTPPTVPGPALTATAGDTVNIHLMNSLTGPYTEPTSVVIPGQLTTGTPTWSDNSTGNRGASLSKRVRSFAAETAVGNTPVVYTWTGVKAGTYLYQSGTHPAVQVQMGLYGTLKVLSEAGRAYSDPSSTFASEVTLLFSEIDPVLHASIAAGHYGPSPPNPAPSDWLTSTVDYHPKYFLINGQAYSPSLPPIPAGTGGNLLVRFLNAGLQSKVPVVQGPYMSVIAEDGNFMTATNTSGTSVPAPKQQYSVFLPAGKTMDAILTSPATGYIPVYDRRLNLTSNGASPGGMLVYLQVGTANQTLTVTKDATLGFTGIGTVTSVSAPGGINCGSVCTQSYLNGTVVDLTATPAAGNAFDPLTGWTGCDSVLPTGDCQVTMTGPKTVNADFRLITKVTVLTPKGGEVIPTGSTYTITWEAPAAAVKFNLQYSINNGTSWKTIANGVTGTSYNWTVPAQTANRPLSKVRVIGLNAAGTPLPAATGTGISNAFTIEVVRLTAPNGGETLHTGATQPITWTTYATTKPVTSVVLQYSTNGGTSWKAITTVTGNPGTYNWIVPAVTSATSRVRVRLRNGAAVIGTDMSDANFAIAP